ncbi:hypothetical protein [Flaviaesturariibacter amylovorans]|uniref:Uncharacterized protein n=1 Tax=Flaviaesturariibacter amylovorans TaxID=1084520 RepID=A0ABP8GGP3_9BACT
MKQVFCFFAAGLLLACNNNPSEPRAAGQQSASGNNTTVGKQQEKIEFKAGDPVDVLYAGSYYPATIVSFDAGKNCYEVKYDDPASSNACKEISRLKPRGKSYAEPYSNKPEDAYGTWKLSTVTQTTSSNDTHVITETNAYAGLGTLTINADKTFVWNAAAGEVIEGTWDLNPSPSQYRGPIHIAKGKSGKEWFVGYYGKDDQGIPSLYVASADGLRYFGGR